MDILEEGKNYNVKLKQKQTWKSVTLFEMHCFPELGFPFVQHFSYTHIYFSVS